MTTSCLNFLSPAPLLFVWTILVRRSLRVFFSNIRLSKYTDFVPTASASFFFFLSFFWVSALGKVTAYPVIGCFRRRSAGFRTQESNACLAASFVTAIATGSDNTSALPDSSDSESISSTACTCR